MNPTLIRSAGVLALLILLGIGLVVLLGDREPTSQPARSDVNESVLNGTPRVLIQPVVASRFEGDTARSSLLVKDRLTLKPIQNCSVYSRLNGVTDTRPSDLLGDTNGDGKILRLPAEWREEPIRVVLNDQLGGSLIDVELSAISRESHTIVAMVPAYAGVEISITDATESSDLRVTLTALPSAGGSNERSNGTPAIDPARRNTGMHRRSLMKRGLLPKNDINLEDRISGHVYSNAFAYDGEIEVTLLGAGIVPSTTRGRLERGVVSKFTIETRAKPRVTGVVVDMNNSPIPNASVTIYCAMHLESHEVVTDIQRDSSAPASTVVTDLKTGRTVSVAKRTVLTNKRGEFTLAVPYTGDVVACSFVAGLRGGIARVKASDRYAPVTNLRVVCAPNPKGDGALMMGPDGRELQSVEMLGSVDFSFEFPFKIAIPGLRTDENGRLSLGWLLPGFQHSLFIHKQPGVTTPLLASHVNDSEVSVTFKNALGR